MEYYFNNKSERLIRQALQELNTQFYYGCAEIELETEGYFSSIYKIDCQEYIATIWFQHTKYIIEFVVKSDGTGDIDYIDINDGYSIDKLINIIQQRHNFYGIEIESIEEKTDFIYDSSNSYKFYHLIVK